MFKNAFISIIYAKTDIGCINVHKLNINMTRFTEQIAIYHSDEKSPGFLRNFKKTFEIFFKTVHLFIKNYNLVKKSKNFENLG